MGTNTKKYPVLGIILNKVFVSPYADRDTTWNLLHWKALLIPAVLVASIITRIVILLLLVLFEVSSVTTSISYVAFE